MMYNTSVPEKQDILKQFCNIADFKLNKLHVMINFESKFILL
jgi:hypothetical protein